MAKRLNQILTQCQEKELYALELSQKSKKQLEDLLRVEPRKWTSFFAKKVDTLFKEIMSSVRIKQQNHRKAGKVEKLKVEEALIILNQPLELRDVLTPLQYQLWDWFMQGFEEITDTEDEGIQDSQVKKEEGIVMKPVRSSDSSSDEDETKKSSASASSSSSDEDQPKKSSTASSSNEEFDEVKKEEKEDEDSDSDTLVPVDDLIPPSPTLQTPKMPTLSENYKIPKKEKTTLASGEEDLPSTTLESLKKGKCNSYCGQFIFLFFLQENLLRQQGGTEAQHL